MLVSDGGGSRSSSTRLERLDALAGGLLSFLGVVHFRGLGVRRLRTKVLLTILQTMFKIYGKEIKRHANEVKAITYTPGKRRAIF